eukprot:scaffold13982_cov56-Phaeocystis_antarctica.AAC.2
MSPRDQRRAGCGVARSARAVAPRRPGCAPVGEGESRAARQQPASGHERFVAVDLGHARRRRAAKHPAEQPPRGIDL